MFLQAGCAPGSRVMYARLDGHANGVGTGNIARERADGLLHLVEPERMGVRLRDQVPVALMSRQAARSWSSRPPSRR